MAELCICAAQAWLGHEVTGDAPNSVVWNKNVFCLAHSTCVLKMVKNHHLELFLVSVLEQDIPVSFYWQFDTTKSCGGRGSLNWGVGHVRLACGQMWGVCLDCWLMWEAPALCGQDHHWLVVLGCIRKLDESKPVSRVLPWFLLLGGCLAFLPAISWKWPVTWKYKM